MKRRFGLFGPLMEALEERALPPGTPHWYVLNFAVSPTAQGRGHGARLLRWLGRCADHDGVPILLNHASGGGNSYIAVAYGMLVTVLTTATHAIGDPYLSHTDRLLMLPGQFETDRLTKTLEAGAKAAGISAEENFDRKRQGNPARRFGQPAEFGAVCAFLCSQHAGYLNAQNILLDGGSLPGTF